MAILLKMDANSSQYKLGTGITRSFKKLQARCGSYLNVLQHEIVNVSSYLGGLTLKAR